MEQDMCTDITLESTANTIGASTTVIHYPTKDTSITDLGTDTPAQPFLQRFPINSDIATRKVQAFRPDWYGRFDWLEYSAKLDAAFCFVCRNFQSESAQNDSTLTSKGFRNWPHAMDKAKDFIKHEKSELHKFCYFKWGLFMKISQGKEVTIESRICPAREEIMSNNGELFKLLVDYILFFMVN